MTVCDRLFVASRGLVLSSIEKVALMDCSKSISSAMFLLNVDIIIGFISYLFISSNILFTSGS